jgi:hypothetical protein
MTSNATEGMDAAQQELNAAVDEVTDWLEHFDYTDKDIEPSLKRLNSARLRMLVLQQRARAADSAGMLTSVPPKAGDLLDALFRENAIPMNDRNGRLYEVLQATLALNGAHAHDDEARALLVRCLPIIRNDAQMMADITRHAPLDAESQAKHDSTEYESEKLLREIPAFLGTDYAEHDSACRIRVGEGCDCGAFGVAPAVPLTKRRLTSDGNGGFAIVTEPAEPAAGVALPDGGNDAR